MIHAATWRADQVLMQQHDIPASFVELVNERDRNREEIRSLQDEVARRGRLALKLGDQRDAARAELAALKAPAVLYDREKDLTYSELDAWCADRPQWKGWD